MPTFSWFDILLVWFISYQASYCSWFLTSIYKLWTGWADSGSLGSCSWVHCGWYLWLPEQGYLPSFRAPSPGSSNRWTKQCSPRETLPSEWFWKMEFSEKTHLKIAACLLALLTWLSGTQWACWPSHLFQQWCLCLLPLGTSVGGSHCCLPDWCWKRWNWSSAPSLALVMTGPPSESQSHLVEKKVKGVCAGQGT